MYVYVRERERERDILDWFSRDNSWEYLYSMLPCYQSRTTDSQPDSTEIRKFTPI